MRLVILVFHLGINLFINGNNLWFLKNDQTSKKQFNCLATTLTTSKETIYDNAVLICSKINKDVNVLLIT